MENLHLLTRDEIADKLKAMEVGEGKELPIKGLSFIVENRKYDPDSFSQEIEDSEERIDELELINREIHQPGFNFIWNNTLSRCPRNSDKRKANHSKICTVSLKPMAIWASCVQHKDGTRDYYSEELVDKIVHWAELNGGIVDIG